MKYPRDSFTNPATNEKEKCCRGKSMPEKVECTYCGRKNTPGRSSCEFCGANLSEAFVQAYCDRCGIPLGEGVEPAGKCVVCAQKVFLCPKHEKKIVNDEVYCREHESECFIATAVFGTSMHPDIHLLRKFRNDWLSSNKLGRTAVKTYYGVSPPIAEMARKSNKLRKLLRKWIVKPALRLAELLLR